MYEILLKRQVEKDLKKIDRQIVDKIFSKIEGLKENPHPQNSLKLTNTIKTDRLRIGDYRIIYQVDEYNKRIIIFYIRHRKDAYR